MFAAVVAVVVFGAFAVSWCSLVVTVVVVAVAVAVVVAVAVAVGVVAVAVAVFAVGAFGVFWDGLVVGVWQLLCSGRVCCCGFCCWGSS